jgi:hypothetical protein
MTELQDPTEIYRESLAGIPVPIEAQPPVIERAEVWPYPDLNRLWVRVQISTFARFPDLAFTITGPGGEVVTTMFIVEVREPYQSLTMHLRQPPQPEGRYELEIELSRDEDLLDRRTIEFVLAYHEPAS